MTTQDFISSLADWLLADPSHLVAAASGLAALIPTPARDSLAGRLFRIVDILALNILHAKEQGQPTNPPSDNHTTGPTAVATVAGLAILLSACAGQTPQKDVFELRAAYDATVLAPLVRYHALPACSLSASGPCKQPSIDAQLISADQDAATALNAAETAVKSAPGAAVPAALADARAAVATAQTILSHNGIQ
jgi:hypothetical protein